MTMYPCRCDHLAEDHAWDGEHSWRCYINDCKCEGFDPRDDPHPGNHCPCIDCRRERGCLTDEETQAETIPLWLSLDDHATSAAWVKEQNEVTLWQEMMNTQLFIAQAKRSLPESGEELGHARRLMRRIQMQLTRLGAWDQ